MSIWTQVVSSARVDDARIGTDYEYESHADQLKAFFGKECLWESSLEVWEDCEEHPQDYLPCGSEGSLRVHVKENERHEEYDAYVVSIHGSLRDFSNGRGVIDWFKEKIKALDETYPFSVRQAVINVEVEGMENLSWTFKKEGD